MSEPTHEQVLAASRGAQAEMELRETDQAFKDVRAGLLEVIATSAIGETDLREKCFFAIQSLDSVKNMLFQVASGKVMAQHDTMIRDIMAGRDPG